jgi:hypothetical protein
MERRELFKVLGATLVAAREGTAQHGHGTSAVVDVENYRSRFFSNEQYRTIDSLTEIIIPSDEQSPGAHAAGVRFYIDTVLHYADPLTQQHWRTGLAAIDETARAQFGKAFGECTTDEKERLVESMARNEKTPSTELEHFFHVLKQMTVEAYALSEVGMARFLGYKGNAVMQEFPGCTHPEHQT